MKFTAQEMLHKVYTAHRDNGLPIASSYLASYPAILEYFQAIEDFTANQFVVAAHLVYGWMPTILEVNFAELPDVLPLMDAARRGVVLSASQLAQLARTVNNSVIGASKLLHFTNPVLYPIWDSRVYAFLKRTEADPFPQVHHYQVNKSALYETYAHTCRDVVATTDFQPTYQLLLEQFAAVPSYQTFTMTPLRALEYIMFMGGGRQVVVS
ncbi:hypothetical protein [Hymenobacter norwichensis]|uniref:hypothetical protein n=1 Tax=Hymenobacter norwichensis TaxID=223903 RepID=UPI0003B4056F|nr:hypothetical protein [Hymenobacter norwichensis]